jgi:2-polyprenyl-3-methyl-5-hydroxy-6-metoxy-1,4-benzoquinol methylase
MPDPCPLCQGTQPGVFAVASDVEYFTSPSQFRVCRCEACDVLFLSPMPYDRLSEIYPANYYSFVPGNAGLIQRIKAALDRRMFRAILRKIPARSLRVLDVGGGTGWLLDAVKASDRRAMETQIVDIDLAAREAAERAGHRYFLGPIESFETEDRYDLILMLNLIEHVRRPDEILAKARSLLSPGGALLIKTPNFDALDARLFRHRSWAGYHTPRHFVLFNRQSFTRVAQTQGLRVTSFSYTQGAPFWTASVLNELRRLGLVRVSRSRPAAYHPLAPFLQVVFAAVDFIRRPFAPLSQMVFVLERADERAVPGR